MLYCCFLDYTSNVKMYFDVNRQTIKDISTKFSLWVKCNEQCVSAELYVYIYKTKFLNESIRLWHDVNQTADCMNDDSDVIMDAMASQLTSLMIVYSTVYSGADQRKHQSSASLALVRGIYRLQVNSPHKWPVARKMFPLDDVIMTMITLFATIILDHLHAFGLV